MNPLRRLALLLLLGPAAAASAQTLITTAPYTISQPGLYQVAANLIGSNGNLNVIVISAPNVVLDLDEFFVSGPGGNTASQAAAIYVNNVANVTIRNGTVANHSYGIYFNGDGCTGALVERVNHTRCFQAGVYFISPASGSVVRRCTFSQIGGFTGAPNAAASAIYTNGGVRIEGNSIATVTGRGNGTAFGINAVLGDASIGNTISNCQIGISSSKALDNLTNGCATPFAAIVNATGNN